MENNSMSHVAWLRLVAQSRELCRNSAQLCEESWKLLRIRQEIQQAGKTSHKGAPVLAMVSKRSRRSRPRPEQPPCPDCDQPDISLLRVVLIGEILCTDEIRLTLLADLLQQLGLLHLAEDPPAPPERRSKGTLHLLRRPHADRQ
jgi:hypothetical protein